MLRFFQTAFKGYKRTKAQVLTTTDCLVASAQLCLFVTHRLSSSSTELLPAAKHTAHAQ